METKHTKGEWKIWGNVQPNGQLPIVSMGGAVCFIPSKHEDAEANSKLIAAAPELLEVAILVESYGSNIEGLHSLAKQAIKKATS